VKGYDEPEILPSSIRSICLIGADAGQYRERSEYEKVEDLEHYLDGLRKAGLPEQ